MSSVQVRQSVSFKVRHPTAAYWTGCTIVRHTAPVARKLSDGQRAAARYAKTRRGQLGLSQSELAEQAHIGRRTLIDFERERSWPNTDTLARLERMGLDLVVGFLTEYAATHMDGSAPPDVDADIAAILGSNLDPDLKLRLVDKLRSIETATSASEKKYEELSRRVDEQKRQAE